MTTILNGLLGGLLTGILAAVVTRFVADDPSMTAILVEKVTGRPTASPRSRWVAFVVRVGYGCLAGGVLVALELFALDLLGIPPTAGEALGVAVVWSALLFGTLLVGRRSAFPRSFERSDLGGLFVYHLVYGLGLGLWIRLTWIT